MHNWFVELKGTLQKPKNKQIRRWISWIPGVQLSQVLMYSSPVATPHLGSPLARHCQKVGQIVQNVVCLLNSLLKQLQGALTGRQYWTSQTFGPGKEYSSTVFLCYILSWLKKSLLQSWFHHSHYAWPQSKTLLTLFSNGGAILHTIFHKRNWRKKSFSHQVRQHTEVVQCPCSCRIFNLDASLFE